MKNERISATNGYQAHELSQILNSALSLTLSSRIICEVKPL